MLRRVSVLAALSALAIAAPLAVAAPGGGVDRAVGKGMAVACPEGAPPPADPSICFLSPRSFQFAGVSNLKAGKAHGVFRGETFDRLTGASTGTMRGSIFCVTATLNKAVIGVTADESTGVGFAPGTTFYVPMVDNGDGGTAPDLYGPYYLTGGPPADVDGQCTEDVAALQTVTDGDITVRDGAVAAG